MIEVRLFGELRRYTGTANASSGTVLHLPASEGDTVGRVLARLGITMEEVSNIFLNGCLLPRSTYPITLGYPLVAQVPLSPEGTMSTPVRSGDRVGIFPRDMGVFVV